MELKSEKKCVLICDDDEGILDVSRIVLEESGYRVVILSDGKDIRKVIEQEHPDMIFLDLWMPGIGGESITKDLKGNESTKHIPVILVSAHKDTAKICAEVGADDYISKPFNISELEDKVKSFPKLKQ